MNTEKCQNCNKEIKDGLFNSNKALNAKVVTLINEVFDLNKEGYCEKCGSSLLSDSLPKLRDIINNLKNEIITSQSEIPVISINNPYKWEYDVIGLVTAQSVTGTGVFSEISMSLNDLFGSESESMNKKIKDAENICLNRIRKSAWEMGGNAVVALDIDYSEVGSLRGMMMVCCTGTAIRITNTEIFYDETISALQSIIANTNELNRLQDIYNSYNQFNTTA